MRKYKHKVTGYIVKTSGVIRDMYYLDLSGNVCSMLPKEIIENCNDWEELTQKTALFKTLDGVDIFEGDTYWYTSLNNVYKCAFAEVNYIPNLTFSNEIEAKKYITENEKRFSLKDVEKVLEVNLCHGSWYEKAKTIITVLKDLKNLKDGN